jgi:hypothetical protein
MERHPVSIARARPLGLQESMKMDMTKHDSDLHPASVRNQRLKIDRRHFNVIFLAAFPVYLTVYGLGRLLPQSWRSNLFAIELDAGIIEQARLQSNLLASYATMI